GVRRYQLSEGLEAGVEQIQVRTGAGLSYMVTPSRGMDISLAEFCGAPISWQAANGDVHPAYYDKDGLEWLRTAAGGLLMTCGLSQVGAPTVDRGQPLGLHGRIHHLPARQVVAEGRWVGDEYEMRVSGVIEESRIFSEHLRLTREIRSTLGSNRLTLTDVVENIAFEPAPCMLLYHFNFGFPLLMDETTFRFPSQRVTAREAETPVAGYDRWQAPEVGHQERVYFHEELDVKAGWASASIHNPHFPLGADAAPLVVKLSWAVDTLPMLVQWRMAGTGAHVLGIEPTNCGVLGREKAREQGTLPLLEPGEARTFAIELAVEIADQ
ncbi:MAG: aldose 1-epimerase family protein, partial [Chloroflexi bacterium]|nr:aldose 1-epimerase family protein [Chloroflexota bacterium]